MTEAKISDTRELENPEGPNADDTSARWAKVKKYLEQEAVEASGEAEREVKEQGRKVVRKGADEVFAWRRTENMKARREKIALMHRSCVPCWRGGSGRRKEVLDGSFSLPRPGVIESGNKRTLTAV